METKKRKVDLEKLPCADEFQKKRTPVKKKRGSVILVNQMEKHKEYYSYNKKNMKEMAKEYLLENGEKELLPFLSTLIEIQKSRMNPELFENLEGKYYQWKYEKVLKGAYIWKSNSSSNNDSSSDSNNDSDSDSDGDSNNSSSKSKSKKESKPIQSDPSQSNPIQCNNKGISTEEKDTAEDGLKIDSENKKFKEYIRIGKFAKNFLKLNTSRISLELKKGSNFVPWIYFQTVKVEEKKTIGMFAGRNFPPGAGIGFYISYPWFTWEEPFTVEPPESYDTYLKTKHLIPEEETDACMWFYDDEGFMTLCDPISRPADEKGKPQCVSCKRILGMGFHLVNVSDEPNIVVDHNGCVKTTKNINIGTELVM